MPDKENIPPIAIRKAAAVSELLPIMKDFSKKNDEQKIQQTLFTFSLVNRYKSQARNLMHDVILGLDISDRQKEKKLRDLERKDDFWLATEYVEEHSNEAFTIKTMKTVRETKEIEYRKEVYSILKKHGLTDGPVENERHWKSASWMNHLSHEGMDAICEARDFIEQEKRLKADPNTPLAKNDLPTLDIGQRKTSGII